MDSVWVLVLASIAGLLLHLGTKDDFKNLPLNVWDNYIAERPLWAFTTLVCMGLGFIVIMTLKGSLPVAVKTPISIGEWSLEIPKSVLVIIGSVANGYLNSSLWRNLAEKAGKQIKIGNGS